MRISPITLSIFKNLFAAICEEMGVALARSAFSPNIKERKDFSCALFDAQANLVAQAAHIPVHLGSMPLSVEAAIQNFKLQPGDTVILNDPYAGGTHLPDITMISPVFMESDLNAAGGARSRLTCDALGTRKRFRMRQDPPSGKHLKPAFYVANRAHHADVGGQSPGSMPLAKRVEDEGVIIPPTLFYKGGHLQKTFINNFLKQVRHKEERLADLQAQQAAIAIGTNRLIHLSKQYGLPYIHRVMKAYRDYEKKITLSAIKNIPRGTYKFRDYLDDDGLGTNKIAVAVELHIKKDSVIVDLTRSAPQVPGPMNAPFAVTLSAVAYVFRCLVLATTGEDCLSLEPIIIKTRPGSVLHATYPAPVAGGNVETSQRLVDVLFGALSKAIPHMIPAASQGTMNNMACGNQNFSYYETLAGGMGARPNANGIDTIHTHMTNTMNTPIEALEKSLPIRITQYHIRKNSGGKGKFKGGNGLVREYEFLQNSRVSLLTERRTRAPYGLRGGRPGKKGANWLIGKKKKRLPGKIELDVKKGERIRIETPGGGGWGRS